MIVKDYPFQGSRQQRRDWMTAHPYWECEYIVNTYCEPFGEDDDLLTERLMIELKRKDQQLEKRLEELRNQLPIFARA